MDAQPSTPFTHQFEANAPALMGELTSEFVKDKSFTGRNKVRRRIKAVLDMLSVDTTYPAQALPEAERGGGMLLPGGNMPFRPGGGGMADFLDPAQMPGWRNEVLPIPGAQPERDNEVLLQGVENNANHPVNP